MTENEGLLMQKTEKELREDNLLLWRLIQVNSEREMVIFTEDYQFHSSTLSPESLHLLPFLQKHLDKFNVSSEFKIIKRRAGCLYRIQAQRIAVENREYFAFFVSRRVRDMQHAHAGIQYLEEAEVREEIESSVFGNDELREDYAAQVSQALAQKNPVLFFGEMGTGKSRMAQLVYLQSDRRNAPFIQVDFSLINRRTWDFLIGRNTSPLCDRGNTLFLKNIEVLDMERLTELMAALVESDVAKRNRVMISCATRRTGASIPQMQKTLSVLSCLPIHMTPLRGQYKRINNAVLGLLQDYREKSGVNVGDPGPKAMELMLHYAWPQNYRQLTRVVKKVATLAGECSITEHMVSEALTTEMLVTVVEIPGKVAPVLDLTKSMDEINGDIVRIVLEQKNGNQSLTAKSLGISRTTMWRMLKTQKE